jgi:sigma-B regulation protein RsbQ
MSIFARHNVKTSGNGDVALVFAHGYGCDQNMWRLVAPDFERDYRVVLFDHAGSGNADPQAYDAHEYSSLQRYADDVLAIRHALASTGIREAMFVGHSVSAMIGVLAAIKDPSAFSRLVLVGPSPCYINDGEYAGGFERKDVDSLLDFLDDNYLGWAQAMAPVIMGNADRPELGAELANSFCRTDPEIAKQFARVTFLSDNRNDLPSLATPCLIMQCMADAIAPEAVGDYLHARLAESDIVKLKATGHCPQLSAPAETVAAMRAYLQTA